MESRCIEMLACRRPIHHHISQRLEQDTRKIFRNYSDATQDVDSEIIVLLPFAFYET